MRAIHIYRETQQDTGGDRDSNKEIERLTEGDRERDRGDRDSNKEIERLTEG